MGMEEQLARLAKQDERIDELEQLCGEQMQTIKMLRRELNTRRMRESVIEDALDARQLLVAFKTQVDDMLLRGVIHVLRALAETAREFMRVPSLPEREAAYYAGAEATATEAEDRILDLVDKANRSAKGEMVDEEGG